MAEIPNVGEAIRQVHEDLNRVRLVRKCTSCECLLDVLQAVQVDLAGIGSPEAQSARADFRAWFEAGNAKRHGCLGCEVCLPTEPYNRFSSFLQEAGIEQRDSPVGDSQPAVACGCGDT